ncbi:M48 family metallopeptidase [Fulvivirgaceae bacterium BMA12]|uniref:M48 family metallopeptidase n=1 Tax=Agaribacillus aureus TaxID=3051825 RepID=A0ABT8L9B5_9BACT|nr:M48 family metallopeptidase [Fulvivirgaceae bacterium BMA12]
MDAPVLLILILSFVTFDFILEQILDFLNLKHQKKEIPDDLKGIYDEEKYQQSLAYQKENTKLSFITSSLSFLLAFTLLATGGFGYIDSLLRNSIDNSDLLPLVYFGVLFLASDLLNTPFQWYHTFVIEEKFGFNKTTPKLFIIDKLKGYLIAFIIGGLLLWILIMLLNQLGEGFWIYFLLVIAVFMLFMNMFYTTLILPLFNKLTPLEDGALKQAIHNYSLQINFPIHNIFVIDGSKRSGKANAFFSGLGRKKKIVLYDTLINNHSIEELVAVLAHEVGHYKKRHIISGLALSVFQVAIMLFILSKMIFNEQLSLALGAEQWGIHLNLMAFTILYSPISRVTGLLMNVFSRKNEFEADAFATNTYDGDALKVALKKLSVDNLSNLLPHYLYVFFHYSHPPLLQRLKAIDLKQKQLS